MATTTNQGFPYPALGDAANGPVAVQNLALAAEKQSVMTFASSTDRDTKLAAPVEGMVAYLRDVDTLSVYANGAWAGLYTEDNARCRATQSGTPQSIPNNGASYTPITFNVNAYNVGNVHDTVTNNTRFTVPRAGTYLVTASVPFSGSGTGTRYIRIRVNGNDIGPVHGGAPASTSVTMIVDLAEELALAANDYVEIGAFQNSGAALALTISTNFIPYCTIRRVC